MPSTGYCFNILETLLNLLAVLNRESRRQMQFSLLVIGLFRSAAVAWKGLTRACLPLQAVAAAQAGWSSRYKAGGCFTLVPLRCSSATGQPAQGRHGGCGMGGHLFSSPQPASNTLAVHFLCSALIIVHLYSAVFVMVNFPDSLLKLFWFNNLGWGL